MSTSDMWVIIDNLCRCCHAQGTLTNLGESCSDSDEKIYADMINNCFGINLIPVPGILNTVTYSICDECIKCVKDAIKFKTSVLKCEEKFREFCDKNQIEVKQEPSIVLESIVKQEISDTSLDVLDDNSLEDESKDHLADLPDYGSDDHDEKLDEEEYEEKNKKIPPKETKKDRPTLKRVLNRTKKVKKEPIAQDNKEITQPKFRLKEADYTSEGAIFSCARCDKKYDKIYSLKYHVKTIHYKIARYKCNYCKKEFMTPAPLTVHKLEEHNIDDRYKCNACKGAFNTKVQLRKHINNFHMLGQRITCDLCDYESFSFESMYKHKFKHKTSKDHKCKFCRKAFLRKTTLDLHERIHTGDRRKVCSVCGQAFVQKASLNYHMTKYHPEVNY